MNAALLRSASISIVIANRKLNLRDTAKWMQYVLVKTVPLFSIFYVKVWSLSITKRYQVYVWPNPSWNHYLSDALVQTVIVACGNVWLISWLSVNIKLVGAVVDWIYFKNSDGKITHLNTKSQKTNVFQKDPNSHAGSKLFLFFIWLVLPFYPHPQPSFCISGTRVHHGPTHHQKSGGFPAALRSFWNIWC